MAGETEALIVWAGLALSTGGFLVAVWAKAGDGRTKARLAAMQRKVENERSVRDLDAALQQLAIVGTTFLPTAPSVDALRVFEMHWSRASGRIRGTISGVFPGHSSSEARALLRALSGTSTRLALMGGDDTSEAGSFDDLWRSIVEALEGAEALGAVLKQREI